MTETALLAAGVLIGFLFGLLVALASLHRVLKNERDDNKYLRSILSEMAEIHTQTKANKTL